MAFLAPNRFREPHGAALTARFTTPATREREDLIDFVIAGLKQAGVWDNLDLLYVTAAHNSVAAIQNWKSASYTLSPTNSPTFTADRGYTGDGTTSYLETNFAPNSVSGAKFTRNSSHLGAWLRTNIASDGGVAVSAYSFAAMMCPRGSTGPAYRFRINQSSTSSVGSNSTSVGHTVVNRTSSTTEEVYKSGAQVTTTGVSSVALTAGTAQLLAASAGSFSAHQIAAAHIGGSLSAVETDKLYRILKVYMDSVGV